MGIEIGWTVIAVVGAVAAIRLAWLAYGDREVLKGIGVPDGRVIVAKSNLRFGIIIALNETWWFLLGLLTFLPNQLPRWLTLTVFLSFRALFVWGLVMNLRDRKLVTEG